MEGVNVTLVGCDDIDCKVDAVGPLRLKSSLVGKI